MNMIRVLCFMFLLFAPTLVSAQALSVPETQTNQATEFRVYECVYLGNGWWRCKRVGFEQNGYEAMPFGFQPKAEQIAPRNPNLVLPQVNLQAQPLAPIPTQTPPARPMQMYPLTPAQVYPIKPVQTSP